MAEQTARTARGSGVKPTRSRRYLTPDELKTLVDAVVRSAFPERNRLLLLMMYRHGLRFSEATVCTGEVIRAQADLRLLATKREASLWKMARVLSPIQSEL